MGKIVAILWIGAILFGGFWFGYYQEGANSDITIDMDTKLSMRGQPFQFKFDKLYASGGKLAVHFDLRSRQFSSEGMLIYDTTAKEQIVVFDAAKIYMRTPFDLVDKSDCKPAETMLLMEDEDAERLPDSKVIAGYRCHAFGAKQGSSETMKAWFTYELRLGRSHVSLVNKLLRMKSEGGKAMLFGEDSSNEKPNQCSGFDYFPFPLSARFAAEGAQISVEVKSISRDKIDKSVFEVPDSYKEVPPDEMPARMSGGQR